MASLSSVCLARSSWMMPIALLAMISRPNGAVDHRAGGQHDDQQHAEDRVDAGEHVGPHDLGDAARRPGGHVVGLAFGDPLGDFGIGQAGGDDAAVILVNVPVAVVVVVLQRQLVTVERGLGNRSGRRVFGDEAEGEHVAVPMRQRQRLSSGPAPAAACRPVSVTLRRAPVVVGVGADVGRQRRRRAPGLAGGCWPTSEPTGSLHLREGVAW